MPEETPSWRPHPAVLRAAAYAACLVVIGAAAWVVVRLVAEMALVLAPVVVTTFLTRFLVVPCGWLRRRGWRPAPAASVTLLGFLLAVAAATALIAPPVVAEFRDLGPTVEDGLVAVEDWLVEDSGLDLTHADVEDAKSDLADRGRKALEGSEDRIAAGARLALSAITGLILSLILTFFALKDGPRLQEWATEATPERRRADLICLARSAWTAIGGYLRGAALLGALEAAVIGLAMALVGSGLVVPVMVLTFAAAFVPIVGAVVAGIVAVLVTLAVGGLVPALIVAVVAVLVQQLDNDLLAPWIYGRSLSLHPAVILLSITTGTALFGFVGTVLAVPVVAIVLNAQSDLRREREERGRTVPEPTADP